MLGSSNVMAHQYRNLHGGNHANINANVNANANANAKLRYSRGLH